MENNIGGPQFETENKGGWGKKAKGWLNKYGSSVILPIIALLILSGGIYLYAQQKSEEINLPDRETTNKMISDLDINLEEENQEEIFFAAENDGVITEKAAKGEGVTHLARRALQDYLDENPQELTKEQMIYIEDYLKDDTGSRPIEIDEEIAFGKNLIQEAIDASLTLSPAQLKNLEKYSALVAWE